MDAIDRLISQWDTERPELDTEPMALFGRIVRIAKHLETAVAKLHKQYDLKLGEFDVLATLRRSGSPYCLTPSELAASSMLTSGAMTNRLDKLVDKQLVARDHSTEDRRSVTVKLTESGLSLIDELVDKHVALQHQLVENLGAAEREQLSPLLKQWLLQFESD